MKNKIIFIVAVVILAAFAVTKYASKGNATTPVAKAPAAVWCLPVPFSAEEDLHTAMRKLWEDHVTWTRNVIFCIISDMPGGDDATKRLLKNQDDIGNALKPIYGDAAGAKLTELLRTHIVQAAELLKAARKDDKANFDAINKKWMANGEEIAIFLNKANPDNWKLDEMKKMMADHLSLTIEEASARHKKDYSADVLAYDKVHNEILKMADMLTEGIVKQHPEKFKK